MKAMTKKCNDRDLVSANKKTRERFPRASGEARARDKESLKEAGHKGRQH
jgi:hypothetical protein